MNRRIVELMEERDRIHEEQASLYSTILQNSVDVHLASSSVSDIVASAIRYHQLCRAIDAEIDRSRQSWIDRLFHP